MLRGKNQLFYLTKYRFTTLIGSNSLRCSLNADECPPLDICDFGMDLQQKDSAVLRFLSVRRQELQKQTTRPVHTPGVSCDSLRFAAP